MEKFYLKEKVTFVTGGAGYLGSKVCKALGQAGAHVVILDSDQIRGKALRSEMLSELSSADYEIFDMTRLNRLESQIDKLACRYGRMDAWVNCSYPRSKDWYVSVERMKPESLTKNVDLHLNSYVWTSRLAALHMSKSKSGTIVNFSSIYGVQANDFTLYEGTDLVSPLAYSAIKGGIVNATRYLAAYFGPRGVRVNCICPGSFENIKNKLFAKRFANKVPLKRLAKPEEAASVALFLCSEASSYVTGATIMVDGGWTIV